MVRSAGNARASRTMATLTVLLGLQPSRATLPRYFASPPRSAGSGNAVAGAQRRSPSEMSQ
jgi:hypothetical protein